MKYVALLLALISLALPAALLAQIPTPIPAAKNLEELRTASASRATRTALEKFILPLRTQEQAAAFWAQDDARFLSSGTILFNDDAFESTLELVSDIVGVFRVGIGVTVSAPREEEDDSDSREAGEAAESEAVLSRLANSGGIFQVTATLPLFYRPRPEYNSTWALMWTVAGATETPEAGGFLEDPAVTTQSGLELMYERRGMGERINFQAGVVAKAFWFNEAYATKADVSDGFAALLVPRIGFTLLGQTRVDLHWRAGRSSDFDSLGDIGVTIQQVSN